MKSDIKFAEHPQINAAHMNRAKPVKKINRCPRRSESFPNGINETVMISRKIKTSQSDCPSEIFSVCLITGNIVVIRLEFNEAINVPIPTQAITSLFEVCDEICM
jgi:hypothetical protein